jgi:hypothetical protein
MQSGTFPTSGSDAIRLQKRVMAATPSNIPSSILKSKQKVFLIQLMKIDDKLLLNNIKLFVQNSDGSSNSLLLFL